MRVRGYNITDYSKSSFFARRNSAAVRTRNLSLDYTKIAFCAGLDENPNVRNADIDEGRVYVLDLQDYNVRVIDIPQSDDSIPGDRAWRQGVKPLQFFSTFPGYSFVGDDEIHTIFNVNELNPENLSR